MNNFFQKLNAISLLYPMLIESFSLPNSLPLLPTCHNNTFAKEKKFHKIQNSN